MKWDNSFFQKIAWHLIKPLLSPHARNAHIAPLFRSVDVSLIERYGENSLNKVKYKVVLGEKDAIEYEYGRFTIYLSFEELLRGPRENKEFMIIQHRVNHRLFPDMMLIDPKFKKALTAKESEGVILSRKDGLVKAKIYTRKHYAKSDFLDDFELLGLLDEQGKLPKTVKGITRHLFTKDSANVAKRKVRAEISKVRATVGAEPYFSKNFDVLSNEEMLKTVSKTAFDYGRRFGEKEIVDAIVKNQPIKIFKGKNLSYYLVAKEVIHNQGINAAEISRRTGRPEPNIRHGVIALMEHKKGLGLVVRKKHGHSFKLYPSEKFLLLLEKKGYVASQKTLLGFP